MGTSKRATIKDVSQRAGVAVSTVSRVLNNHDRVSPETRKKVMDAVYELSYVQNQLAVGVVTGSTKIILIIVPDFSNSFFGSVIEGAEEYLKNNGYLSLVSSSSDDLTADIKPILAKTSAMIDGAIVIPSGYSADQFSDFSKPVVFVDRTVPDSYHDSVQVDNLGGAYMLTRELLGAGHRKIAIITGRTSLSVGADRLEGYKRALADYNVPFQEEYVRSGHLIAADGYRFFIELLGLDDPPTAILAANNLTCTGCICAAKDLGVVIGEDISLVGFDDTELATLQQPGITVVSRPTKEMGTVAAKMLLDRIQSKDKEPRREIIMPVNIVRRNSVKSIF